MMINRPISTTIIVILNWTTSILIGLIPQYILEFDVYFSMALTGITLALAYNDLNNWKWILNVYRCAQYSLLIAAFTIPVLTSLTCILQQQAYNMAQLADVTTFIHMGVIFTSVFDKILNRNPVTLLDVLLGFTAMIGGILIARPGFVFEDSHLKSKSHYETFGMVLAVQVAILTALVSAAISKYPIPTQLLVQGMGIWMIVFSVFMKGIYATQEERFTWNPVCSVYSRLVYMVESFTWLVNLFVFTKLPQVVSAPAAAILRCGSPVLAYAIQTAVLGYPVRISSLTGAFLIVASIIVISLKP